MQSQVRECDSVARLAPRRFAVLLVECKAPEPLLVVERLRGTLVANLGLRKPELAIAVATYGGSLPGVVREPPGARGEPPQPGAKRSPAWPRPASTDQSGFLIVIAPRICPTE